MYRISFLAFMLAGCLDPKINVDYSVERVKGSSSSSDEPANDPSYEPSAQPANEPSAQPANEPSAQPANEPSGNPNDTGSQGNPNDTGSQGNPNDTGSQGNPNDTSSQGGDSGGGPADTGQVEGGGPDFCVLAQTAIDCGMSASLALNYCDDPASAGDWLLFLDCLVEAGATDCNTLSDCEGLIP